MSLLTESELRKQLRNTDIKEYEVEKGVIITPSAKQYLQDKNIKLVIVDILGAEKQEKPLIIREEEKEEEGKPEHMTQLYGNKLVPKDHRRIEFRGRLDSLQSKILEVQVISIKLQNEAVAKELEEILFFVRNILRAEVLEEKLPEFCLIGMNENDIREVSHNPKKHYNMDHFIPNYKMGELVIALNSIRTNIREVEICSFKAFKDIDGEVTRSDIIRYLNRLSSCLYVMMLKFLSGKYK
ncbi:cobalamin adenosyltransferase [Clostridium sp.]|jgi:ethanolamine utilization cobalamin adenosyltransferase|uniref:cobalamin adenosyltransferase n=1 Tax=Clostridium sp. TaxID=1506 RepID=UPI003EECDE2E